MVRSKKNNKKISKNRTKRNTNNNYNISLGDENVHINEQKICKGRTKDSCIDGTENCEYIEDVKRKYCKRVSKCKKSCQAPCQKINYNQKMYCLPPDKEGNPQKIEDVKDILSELILDVSSSPAENIQTNENSVNQWNRDVIFQTKSMELEEHHDKLNKQPSVLDSAVALSSVVALTSGVAITSAAVFASEILLAFNRISRSFLHAFGSLGLVDPHGKLCDQPVSNSNVKEDLFQTKSIELEEHQDKLNKQQHHSNSNVKDDDQIKIDTDDIEKGSVSSILYGKSL